MHDVIREMAFCMSNETDKQRDFSVHAGVEINGTPGIEKWEGVRRMS